MKKTIITLWLIVTSLLLTAQSNKLVYLQSGETIEFSKVTPKKTNIQFTSPTGEKGFLDYDDVNFIVKRRDILLPSTIREMNFLKAGPRIMDVNDIYPESTCTMGMLDAIQYSKFTGAQIGGGLTGIFWPIGMIGTAAIASVKPNEQSLNFPEHALMEDDFYLDCYRKTAKKQKSRLTWLGASTGFTMTMLIATLVMTLSM